MTEKTILWIIIGAGLLLVVWKVVKWIKEFRDFHDTGDSGESQSTCRPHFTDHSNSGSWGGGSSSGAGAGDKW